MKRIVGLLICAACDGGMMELDAGREDDAGMMADAGYDAGPVLCGALECADGEACIDDECVDACGADPAMFASSIGAGLSVVASFCRPGAAAFATDGTDVFDVMAATDMLTTGFSLFRWPLDPTGAPDATLVGAPSYVAPSADVLAFAGGYLDVGAGGALYGYTTTDAAMTGEVFVVALAGGAIQRASAPGNFDAEWIDATRFVVNGQGFGAETGQGLYVATVGDPIAGEQVATGPGIYSGSVAVRPEFVLAGGADDTFAPLVYAISRTAFDAAIGGAPIDIEADGSMVVDPDRPLSASTFTFAGDRLVLLPYSGPLTSYAVSWDGTDLTLSDARVVAMGPTFNGVLDAGGGRLLLTHPGGALLVE